MHGPTNVRFTIQRPYKKEVKNWRLQRVRGFIWQLTLFGCNIQGVQYYDKRRVQLRVYQNSVYWNIWPSFLVIIAREIIPTPYQISLLHLYHSGIERCTWEELLHCRTGAPVPNTHLIIFLNSSSPNRQVSCTLDFFIKAVFPIWLTVSKYKHLSSFTVPGAGIIDKRNLITF